MFRMMNGDFDLSDIIKRVKRAFPNSFINMNYELILEPTNNIYFRLEGIDSEFHLQLKVLSWLSRPSCKGVSPRWQQRIRKGVNELLGTEFTLEEMELIYTYLGNDCNRPLSEEFVKSGYDLNLLIRYAESKRR